MKANPKFANLALDFWANVKLISEKVGYSKGQIPIIPTATQIAAAYQQLGLNSSALVGAGNSLTAIGQLLIDYFTHRHNVLINDVEPNLMHAPDAAKLYNQLWKQHSPKCPIPINKQKLAQGAPYYLTGIVNILLEANLGGLPCNYNPTRLTSITVNNVPVRTLSRRVDGAFPAVTNPAAIWEIKEYYYTTSFGSRIADGVFETQLDGIELREAANNLGVHIDHYLILDGYTTWWMQGMSYLCRIIDMLNMGTLTEVFFGREVAAKLPAVAQNLAAKYNAANTAQLAAQQLVQPSMQQTKSVTPKMP